MTSLRRRRLEDLQLRGLAPTTQQGYLAAVRHLAHHYRRAPDQLSDEELRQYFLFLLNEQPVAASTFRIHLDGIRFLYERTLKRPWPVFELIRPRPRQKLPVVWSPQEGRSLLALVQRSQARMCLQRIAACGLRLREGTQRQVADIAPQRMRVRVRQGKGGNDRLGPLAERTLELLRIYWQRTRPRPWWCPARDQRTPLPATTRQQTCTRVVRPSGLAQDASIHTLRHSYATHLLARGISWRIIQEVLGHKSPRTTARDTPLTRKPFDVVHATINALMADLELLGVRACQRWRTSADAMVPSIRSGVARIACPVIAAPWMIVVTAGPRPWADICGSVIAAVRSTMPTMPAATAVAPRATITTPRCGWQRGGRNSYQSPTFMSSSPGPTN